MRRVTCSMSASLDGYIAGPDGDIGWGGPDEAVFRSHLDDVRGVGTYLLGRRLYEAMRYWDTVDRATLEAPQLEWEALWRALPKVVFSSTLSAVEGNNVRLAAGGLAEEIARLRAEPGDADIAVGGAMLAGAAMELGLVDEYRIWVYPVLVGGGTPYFPRPGRRQGLELLEARPFDSGVVLMRYGVRREG